MGKGQVRREGRTDGWEGGIDVMPLMKWVHRHSMAWQGCRIGNPSEARYNQLVNQYFFYFDTFVFPACESHGSRRPN